jgi:hypothetical protein
MTIIINITTTIARLASHIKGFPVPSNATEVASFVRTKLPLSTAALPAATVDPAAFKVDVSKPATISRVELKSLDACRVEVSSWQGGLIHGDAQRY